MITNYNTLPLGKYLRIQELINDKSLDAVEVQANIIALLNDMSVEDVLHMPITDFQVKGAATAFLASSCPVSDHIPSAYKLGDLVLVPVRRLEDISFNQFTDFQTYSAAGEGFFAEVLSCFLLPKGKTYGDYDVREVQEAIKDNLSVSDAVSLSAFFLTRLERLTRVTLTSLVKLTKASRMKEAAKMVALQEMQTAIKNLARNGDGLPR